MTNFNDFLQSALKESFFNLTLYTVFGVAVFWMVWKGLKNVWRWRRIQPKSEQRKHFFSHDILFSFSSILLAGFLTAMIALLEQLGYMKLYWEINTYGTTWGILQLFFLLFFYNAYFYWSRRFMHHPKIYRWVHKTHHKSTDPSPLTIFAFHPLKNLIKFLPLLVLPMIIPIFWPILFLWQTLYLLNNLFAHLGYEIYPKNWVRLPFLKYKTASTHHNLNHEKFNVNYGLYFTCWDKWMNTEFKDYSERFDNIFRNI